MCKNKYLWKFIWIPMLCFCVGIGSYQIMAYFMDRDTAVNVFKNGGVKTEIEEDFEEPDTLIKGMTFTKDVKIENTGESNCYVRIKAEFSTSEVADYCTLNINRTDWVYDSVDGYYYYKHLLKEGEITASLFTEVVVSDTIPDEVMQAFDIYIYHESCQAEGFSTYSAAWEHCVKNKEA